MTKFIDLTGLRFGRLFVIERVKNNKHNEIMWKCLCDCKNIVEVRSQHLRIGKTQSCGCYHKEQVIKQNTKDLTGQKFGKLVVIGITAKRVGKNVGWLCKCGCGNEKIIKGSNLTIGKTKSCGCYKNEQISKSNTTHGLSKTSAYKDLQLLVLSGRDILDCGWSRKMDKTLKSLQPVCVVCGSTRKLCIDHVLPFSLGYGLKPGNAVRLCKRCNSSKNNRLPEELSDEIREKILVAAKQFEEYWNSLL